MNEKTDFETSETYQDLQISKISFKFHDLIGTNVLALASVQINNLLYINGFKVVQTDNDQEDADNKEKSVRVIFPNKIIVNIPNAVTRSELESDILDEFFRVYIPHNKNFNPKKSRAYRAIERTLADR